MQNLTDNQRKAMTALIKSCLSNMGGDTLADLQNDPFTWVDTSDLVAAGWSQKEAYPLVSDVVGTKKCALHILVCGTRFKDPVS